MAQIILITGGARSGKSAFAESLFEAEWPVVYMATAQAHDDEMRTRIQHHQTRRSSCWTTSEHPFTLSHAVGSARHYLLDCVGVLASNIMFELTGEYAVIPAEVQQQVETRIIAELEALITRVRAIDGMLVMVTNEVGDSIVPEQHVARVYRDILGRVNQRLAARCHQVYLVVCGLPLQIKDSQGAY